MFVSGWETSIIVKRLVEIQDEYPYVERMQGNAWGDPASGKGTPGAILPLLSDANNFKMRFFEVADNLTH